MGQEDKRGTTHGACVVLRSREWRQRSRSRGFWWNRRRFRV